MKEGKEMLSSGMTYLLKTMSYYVKEFIQFEFHFVVRKFTSHILTKSIHIQNT